MDVARRQDVSLHADYNNQQMAISRKEYQVYKHIFVIREISGQDTFMHSQGRL